MQSATFSSLDGGQAHSALVVSQIEAAATHAFMTGQPVRLQVMCFAFTDPEISKALVTFLQTTPNARVDVLADWSQGAQKSPSVVRGLDALNLPGLTVRLKIDAPYYRHPTTGRVTWGYHHSHGMLHHKTLAVLVADQPTSLVIGSFNWSARGAQSYENTLLIESTSDTAPLIGAFCDEFAAMWHDPSLTIPFATAPISQSALAKWFKGGATYMMSAKLLASYSKRMHQLMKSRRTIVWSVATSFRHFLAVG